MRTSARESWRRDTWADIVVLDRDIRAVPAEQLEQTDVTVTIKSGSVLHSRQ